MALSAKLGSLLRQNVQTSMLSSIRCMSTSSTKLFIGGLSYSTDDQSLREAFPAFGDVAEARVIQDRDSGRSRGFGFVSYNSGEAANSTLSAMDGQELNGRAIRAIGSYVRRFEPLYLIRESTAVQTAVLTPGKKGGSNRRTLSGMYDGFPHAVLKKDDTCRAGDVPAVFKPSA